MISELERLRANLSETNLVMERTSATPDLRGIRKEIAALRARLNDADVRVGMDRDRVREAIIHFRSTGTLDDRRQARLVCSGTTLVAGRGSILMEDAQRFPKLLDQLSPLLGEPRAFRGCWNGLLNGYFTYDPDKVEDGRRNWKMLRRYLKETRTAVHSPGFQPDWVIEIGNHGNLLTDDPCSRYGPSLLAGDRREIEAAWAKMGITDASWVNRRLVEAQITAAVALPDRDFKTALPAMIQLLEAHVLLADDGLSRLLTRYAACKPIEINPALRDFAVTRWGNPWLTSNDMKWSRVTPEVKGLINGWLKLDFIEKFFSLLSADQLNDARRLAFWRRYHAQIDDMHFALGNTATRNHSPDFRALRARMKGLTMDLTRAGGPNNNAFIMRMGRHVFVEFGEMGNALYIFDGDKLPFKLTDDYIYGDSTELKHHSRLESINHSDSKHQTWEAKFADAIQRRTGIRPQGGGSRAPSQPEVGRTDRTVNRPMPGQPAVAASGSRPSRTDSTLDLNAFLKQYGLRSADMRDRGGSLWVYADRHAGLISTWLQAHKFAWSNKRNAWYLTS
jgi:hypothetical protein